MDLRSGQCRTLLEGAGGLWASPFPPVTHTRCGGGEAQDPFSEEANSIPPPGSGKGNKRLPVSVSTLGRQVGHGLFWAPGQESVAQGRQSWRKDQLAGFHCPIFENHWPPAEGVHWYHLLSGRGTPETERKRGGLQIWGGPLRQRKGCSRKRSCNVFQDQP